MSIEPRVGDVHGPLVVTGLSTNMGLVRDFLEADGTLMTYHGDDLSVGDPDFNVFDLLSGDPSAWAAALRFLPAPFLIEVRNGEEKREVMGLPKGCELDEVRLRIPTGHALVQEGVNGWMAPYVTPPVIGADFPTAVNAALAEPEAGSEEGKLCEG